VSLQTILGGPAYFIRNVHYHGPAGGGIKFAMNPAGGVFLHNTFTSGVRGGTMSNAWFRNNLILAEMPDDPSFAVNTFTGYTSSDYNGVLIAGRRQAPLVWQGPRGTTVQYEGERAAQRFATLPEFAAATGQDSHSVAITFDIFAGLTPPDPAQPSRVYDPATIDAALRPGAAAIDAGVPLPGINDGFAGRAPDLGALEAGQPRPHYGRRR
jgi:hypothetical protein